MRYLLVVNSLPASIITDIEKLRETANFSDLGILHITKSKKKFPVQSVPYTFLYCSFEDNFVIEKSLSSYKENIVGVICRGDVNIQYLRKLVKHLPRQVKVSSEESLKIATNKLLMRRAFINRAPDITPAFLQIQNGSENEINRVEEVLKYPVIVKPANLMSSLLIQSCENRSQLQIALAQVFTEIAEVYRREGRMDTPEVIVEDFMQGNFYSIDAYVREQDDIQCCPIVEYVAAKQIGIDDFFLYKRFIPTSISESQISLAMETTKKALQAIGLTHSSAHVELILTASGWKIIEVGPRIGRFRNRMYKLAYGFNHSMNDILIHLGQETVILNELVSYTSCYSIYPNERGILKEVVGIDGLSNFAAVTNVDVNVVPGKTCELAKHGGKAIAEVTISSVDQYQYCIALEYIEKNVYAAIEPI